MPLVCGVDSGTGSTKIEVRDAGDGRLVASGSASHPPTTPPVSEQDPASWWQAFEAAYSQAGSPEVAAIAVAGQQHGLVALDDSREVIRPAKLWNDTTAAPDAERLVEALGAEAWARACGSVPVAAFTIAKLAWLRRREPASFERLAHVLLPHDWITLQLTGALVTDRGDASGTGYWSPSEEAWRTDLLDLVDPDVDWGDRLPRVLGPTEAAGEWREAIVAPGTGDNMSAALGLGLRTGDVAISIGTSGTVYTPSPDPTADTSGAVAGFADAAGAYLRLVCTLNATKVTDAVARLLGVDHDGFDELALAAEPGAGGLTLVPYLDGGRTPNRPDATGVLSGVRSDVSREQLARAAVEGVACGLLDGLDALAATGVATDGRIFCLGGGARSQAYRRILADLLGRSVVIPDSQEQVATGACVQATALLSGRPLVEITGAWDAARGASVDPDLSVDAVAIRQTYAATRDLGGS